MSGARVAAIIVNWRAPVMTLAAVRRAFDQTLAPAHVFVVENGSGDGSEAVLRAGLAAYGHRATLIVNDDNLGFGGGCNAALRPAVAADYAYCWLLNNDAEPEPGCLAALVATAEHTSNVGAVGSRLFDHTAPEDAHYGSWMNPVTLTSYPLHAPGDIARHRYAWLTAASLLLSTAALQAIGLFDEAYFMYWEDADLNARLRAAGYTLTGAADAGVAHVAGTSSAAMATRRYVWHLQSQRRWLRKHHAWRVGMGAWVRARYLLKAATDRDGARFQALIGA